MALTILPLSSTVHIALVGDSIMRYQYYSLVEYIMHSYFWDNVTTLQYQKGSGSSNEYDVGIQMNHNSYEPFEECDCFTYKDAPEGNFTKDYCENRYFLDSESNISISFHVFLGNLPSIGHWNPHEVHSRHSYDYNTTSAPSWIYGLSELIEHHISLLNPRPDWIVLNCGHWPNNFKSLPYREEVIRALHRAGIKWAWRTTTATRDGKPSVKRTTTAHIASIDRFMCRMASACVATHFTYDLSERAFVDNVHFVNAVYHIINSIMISQLNLDIPNHKSTALHQLMMTLRRDPPQAEN